MVSRRIITLNIDAATVAAMSKLVEVEWYHSRSELIRAAMHAAIHAAYIDGEPAPATEIRLGRFDAIITIGTTSMQVEAIDRLASQAGQNRSEFMRNALHAFCKAENELIAALGTQGGTTTPAARESKKNIDIDMLDMRNPRWRDAIVRALDERFVDNTT